MFPAAEEQPGFSSLIHPSSPREVSEAALLSQSLQTAPLWQQAGKQGFEHLLAPCCYPALSRPLEATCTSVTAAGAQSCIKRF